MKIFVSHVREEKAAAVALKTQLEAALPGVTAWVSTVDLGLGQAWLQALEKELKGAKALLVLCGSQSASKPWINFESGFGYGKRVPVIPVCHRGLRRQQLPYPLSMFQACDTAEPDDITDLVRRLAEILRIGVAQDFEAEAMSKALVPRPQRRDKIGVVLAHKQTEWAMTGHSLFKIPNSLPESLRNRWKFRRLTAEDKIASAELSDLSGMIVGSPWRSSMSLDCIDELVEWVHSGGRMLLLGFELGDRHHGGNLGDLARRFGIHPMIDIVGPRHRDQSKPYGIWMDFLPGVAQPHPLTAGLSRIRLRNVQSVIVEPGGIEWLCIGEHAIYRPARESSYYREGKLSQPSGGKYEVNSEAAWVPLAVDAPVGLTYSGTVRFIGTWDLLRAPDDPPEHSTPQLVERLLNWLSGEGPS